MEAAIQPRASDGDQPGLVVVPPTQKPSSDRVVDFSSSMKEKLAQSAGDGAGAGKRDWSSALDLVSEAFEAIRMADERAAAAEEYQAELAARHADQVKVLETRIAAAEKRSEAAESRAKVAEGWLSKFHDTIMDEFQRTLTSRHGGR